MTEVVSGRTHRRAWRLLAPVAVLAVVATGCFGAAGGAESADMLNRVNYARGSVGAPGLVLCGTLNSAAYAHAQDMAAHGNYGHVGTDGSQPPDRMARAGYGPVGSFYWGENLHNRPGGVTEVFNDWMASGPHRANILNSVFRHMGFAHVGTYWVAVFGALGRC